jgi:hypothetical protein
MRVNVLMVLMSTTLIARVCKRFIGVLYIKRMGKLTTAVAHQPLNFPYYGCFRLCAHVIPFKKVRAELPVVHLVS